ncbi:MAG: hypothetical protein AAF483_21830 [Planctomycetota bacterium]
MIENFGNNFYNIAREPRNIAVEKKRLQQQCVRVRESAPRIRSAHCEPVCDVVWAAVKDGRP